MRKPPTFITTAQVAATLGVSGQSVRTWCRHGLIAATRPSGTRKWLISEDDFYAWMQTGAGPRVRAFLDPAHRSTAGEDELLVDANEALSLRSPRVASAKRRAVASTKPSARRSA